jgi:hypothetical protein
MYTPKAAAIGPRLQKSSAHTISPQRTSPIPFVASSPLMAFSRVALPLRQASVTRNVLSRHIHSSPLRAAIAHPITAQGPPPKAPTPAEAFRESAAQSNAGSAGEESQPNRANVSLKKRFWKDVHVYGKPGMYGWSAGLRLMVDLRVYGISPLPLPLPSPSPSHRIELLRPYPGFISSCCECTLIRFFFFFRRISSTA